MSKEDELAHFDRIVSSKNQWLIFDFKKIWSYKDLIFLFVKRDFISLYKQTILGPIWFIAEPLITMIVFTFIFGFMAKLDTSSIPKPLFYLAGITMWNYFSECLIKTSNTFINNRSIFDKVYFPRIVVPISIVISGLLKFSVQILLFFIICIYYSILNNSININVVILLFPLLVLIMAGLGLGFGLIISAITTKYRDLRFLIEFGVKLLMYGTTVVYPLSMAGDYKWIILANPMTSIIETFKYGIFSKGVFDWFYLSYSFIFMVIVMILGFVIFSKTEKSFIDTI